MAIKSSSLALLGAFAAKALAHGTVNAFATNGERHPGYLLDYYYLKLNGGTPPALAAWSAENLDNGFVDATGYKTADINCHINSAPGSETVSIPAGGDLDFFWTVWPESHFGPVMTYVAKCPADCADVDKTTLKWVKIDEAGYDQSTKTWAATDLIKNNNTWTTTVPSTLAPGNYVFRHEIIAMHGAGSPNGAQNYPQCFNVEVTGSGTENPEGVLGTELYTGEDPGILFNPYGDLSGYKIPGPPLFGTGGGSGGGGSGNGTTPAPAPAPPAPPAPEEPATTPAPTPETPATTPAPTPEAPDAEAAPGAGDEEDVPAECPAAARRRARRHARRHARHLRI